MGANYAEAVYEQYPELHHRAHRVMVRMALIVRDSDREPKYWAGWQVLAYAIGLDMPFAWDTSPRAEQLRRNAQAVVAKVVRELMDANAISSVRRGRLGVQAEYRLNLRPVDKSRYREPVDSRQG